jgi:hypothetical protein
MTSKKSKPASKKPSARVGRPSKCTPELMDEVCDRLSDGEPLEEICRDGHMPSSETVRQWQNKDTGFAKRVAIAREIGFDVIAAETLRIADDGRNDYIENLAEGGDERAAEARLNGEHVQRSRLRVETRLKLLAKWDPKRYGDRVQHTNDPDNPLPQPSVGVVIIPPKRQSDPIDSTDTDVP